MNHSNMARGRKRLESLGAQFGFVQVGARVTRLVRLSRRAITQTKNVLVKGGWCACDTTCSNTQLCAESPTL